MIPIFEPDLGPSERANLISAIDGGWISSQGQFITDFERAFAKFHDVKTAVATSSCTTALHLALSVLGVGPGDEVLCPDLTFIAPANMIRLAGANPILVDVEQGSWAISPPKIEASITKKTKAIVVVHPFGHAADMGAIMAIARKHGLKVIEDVAEAPGAKFKGQILGTIGDLSCFSFFANKIITTGEGGMVLCNNPELDEALRIYRDHGMSREKRYVHVVAGYNYRMTNMQASIGLAQLERLPKIIQLREAQAKLYEQEFSNYLKAQWRPRLKYSSSVHWMATITLRNKSLRAPLLNHLAREGIDARQMVFPVHMAEPYKANNNPKDFPITLDISLRSLHLPSSTSLNENQIVMISRIVKNWLNENDE